MKSKILFTLFLSLFLSNHLSYAQSLTVVNTSCNSIKANMTNVPQDLFLVSQSGIICSQFVEPRNAAGASVPGARYILEKHNGFTFVEAQNSNLTNSGVWNFTNLSQGIYRVKGRVLLSNGDPVFSITNPCNLPVGRRHNGQSIQITSSNIEIGIPASSFTIWDNSGGIGNSTFCVGDPIVIDGSNSFAETAYRVNIAQKSANGQTVNYNTSGWINGKVGTVDLLNDVWQQNGSNWIFWEGYTYEVTLAIKKSSCIGWVASIKSFEVVNSGCRLGETKSDNTITLSPNPASDFIKLDGFDYENIPNEIDFQIFNAAGKLMQKNKLYSVGQSIDISDLTKGMYILRFLLEDEVVSKKFVVN